MGHWYLIVSIDFHENVVTNMIILRQGYALGFVSSMQGNLAKGWTARDRVPMELGRCVTARKVVNGFPEGLCIREGKALDGFVLVISISRWNQMHIGSVPWDSEPVTVH